MVISIARKSQKKTVMEVTVLGRWETIHRIDCFKHTNDCKMPSISMSLHCQSDATGKAHRFLSYWMTSLPV